MLSPEAQSSGIPIPPLFLEAMQRADPSWRFVLQRGLAAISAADPHYLPSLANEDWLPAQGRIFAAFCRPLQSVRYVLVGEGPYPRAESATGFCFMDGAVDVLWSENGLSKKVNRATSLRNFMKMLLVAEGELPAGETTGDALVRVAQKARGPQSGLIQTLGQLQQNLMDHGFLLLNAAMVFRPHVAPHRDGRAWRPFLQTVLAALGASATEDQRSTPTLVLWGKIAEALREVDAVSSFQTAIAEHPYNLSFIDNPTMHALFRPMHLLRDPARTSAA